MTAPPVLALRNIRKRFGSVQALQGADFTLMPGELHALLGENGAGKTTLMHVAYGLVRADGGTIAIGGVARPAARAVGSPRAARRMGIGMVHQHFTSVPALSVAENVALAAAWPVAPGPLHARVRALAERSGLPLDPTARVAELSVALKQRLEIVKALAADARILLLDEPTAALAPVEAAELLRIVRAFTAAGGAAVLITHKLDEALSAAHRVTVLRQGKVVFEGVAAGQSGPTLAALMMGDGPRAQGAPGRGPPRASIRGLAGRTADSTFAAPAAAAAAAAVAATAARRADQRPLVRLEELEVPQEGGYGIAVRRATLSIGAGEIVAIAAIEGNGQRELLRAVSGRLPLLRGRLEVAAPVAFIPEDRTTEGLIPELTLTENVVLASRADDPWIRGGRINWAAAQAHTTGLLLEYAVVAAGPGTPAGALSGGNQQKLVVARELARGPRVVVAENPTRGLDVRAAGEIHARLRGAAAGGAAVLVYSSDLDEVLALGTRVLVMARGALLALPPTPPAGADGGSPAEPSSVPPGPELRARIGALMVSGGR